MLISEEYKDSRFGNKVYYRTILDSPPLKTDTVTTRREYIVFKGDTPTICVEYDEESIRHNYGGGIVTCTTRIIATLEELNEVADSNASYRKVLSGVFAIAGHRDHRSCLQCGLYTLSG